MVPDKDDVFKPKKLLLLVAGFALCTVVGVVAVMLAGGVDRKRVLPSFRT
jgi:uncharacterized protein involved in exopolysaccharide biosynthesis